MSSLCGSLWDEGVSCLYNLTCDEYVEWIESWPDPASPCNEEILAYFDACPGLRRGGIKRPDE